MGGGGDGGRMRRRRERERERGREMMQDAYENAGKSKAKRYDFTSPHNNMTQHSHYVTNLSLSLSLFLPSLCFLRVMYFK